MNFIQYLHRGKFLYYAAVALVVAIIVMLAFYIVGVQRFNLVILCAWGLIFLAGITGNYIRWLRYKSYRNKVMDFHNRFRSN